MLFRSFHGLSPPLSLPLFAPSPGKDNFAYVLPGTRKIAVCKELTKRHEKVMQCTLEEACTYYEKKDPKGEFVFVVEGADIEELESIEQQKWEEVPIEEHMQNYLSRGMERKEAMKAVAKDRGMTKNQVYKELMK